MGTGQDSLRECLVNVVTDVLVCQSGLAVTTQQADGSWEVKGTKEGKKNKVEETATFWGSAWATIAILQNVPKSPGD